jgi:ATP-dependent protease ClpP protease subunit
MTNKLKTGTLPFFRASMQSGGCLELIMYEDIGKNPWTGEGLTAKTVKAQLDAAGKYAKISLRINSPGGDAFEGVAIGNLLKSTGKPINVYVDGIAASAASIIAMCGDVQMAPNAMMMIHRAWMMGAGNTNDFAKLSETLSKVDEAISQTYSDKTGKSANEVLALMDAETWMSAEDCVSGGFASSITGEDNPEAMAMARGFKSLARCKAVPGKLARLPVDAKECACECAECVANDCGSCSNAECEDPDCEGCPMQVAEQAAESNLSLYEARLTMLLRGQ